MPSINYHVTVEIVYKKMLSFFLFISLFLKFLARRGVKCYIL